jgi:hypothetical protein
MIEKRAAGSAHFMEVIMACSCIIQKIDYCRASLIRLNIKSVATSPGKINKLGPGPLTMTID